MQIIRRLEELPFDRNSVVTVGMFDGVHLAHQEILRQAVARAQARRGRSVVVTFDPHPKTVVDAHPDDVRVLTSVREREELCGALGIDLMFVVAFDADFSHIPFRDFTRRYLVEGIGAAEVLEGYDHHWGRNREGDVPALKQLGAELGFAVMAVDPIRINGSPVNSSAIRSQLLNGRVEDAAALLGRPYEVRGTVVHGDERGRSLGYPTANIAIDDQRKLIPQDGIYVVAVTEGGRRHPGLVSIGVRPTFHTAGRRTVEAHLLDFSGELYGQEIRLGFLRRLREELKFDSAEALVAQMKRDESDARRLLSMFPSEF